MARTLIWVLALAGNIAIVAVSLAPNAVTFAEIVPKSVGCIQCNAAEEVLLIKAASAGREQVLGLFSSLVWVFVTGAVLNVGALVYWVLDRHKNQP